MCKNLKFVQTHELKKSTPDQLSQYDLIWFISDVFPENQVLEFKNKFPNIVAVLSDCITLYDLKSVNFYGVPGWLANQAKNFFQGSYDIPTTTRYTFTFNANKKLINRFLLIKFVEWFQFKDFCYTWSGVDNQFDMKYILDELNNLETQPFDQTIRNFLLAPITLEKNFIQINNDQFNSNSCVSNSGTPFDTWKYFLSQMTYESAVTLIGESVGYDHAMIFTEKTLYSVLGLTFPIWIGGYKQASEWKKYGFDTFDDVIDHSYQNCNTLIERIYYAFVLNRDILDNIKLATTLRAKYLPRLLNNRQLLLDNHLSYVVESHIAKMPIEIQQLILQHKLLFFV